MGTLLIIDLVLVIIMFILCIETFIFYKNNGKRRIEQIKDKFLLRVRIITILAVIIGLLGITNIIMNR